MSIASGAVRGRGVARSGTVLMARIIGANAALITQASLSAIAFLLRDITAQSSGTQRTLTIADVVYDSLQTGAGWTEDSSGYNFRYTIPASDISWTPSLDSAGNPIAHQFQADVRFTPASGEPFVVPFYFWAIPTWVSG